MKIKHFGMPTLLELGSIEECAKLCMELGLKFVEINMNFPIYQLELLNPKILADIAEKYGIYYTIHLEEKFSPCDFNEKVAKAYTETVLEMIELAKKLNVSIINMHLTDCVFVTLPTKKVFLFDTYNDAYMQKLISFRNKCEAAIGDSGIRICVENTGGFNSADYLQKSLETLLESPAFAMTFDIGHNACIDFADDAVINEHIGRLSHMHIHDAKEKSNHLTLGDGNLDLQRYINMATEYDCRMVLETKTITSLKNSVRWLKENGLFD